MPELFEVPSSLSEIRKKYFDLTKPNLEKDFKSAIDKELVKLPKPKALLGGPLEFEMWFVGLLRGLLDARTASNEWLSLKTILFNLDVEAADVAIQCDVIKNQELPHIDSTMTQLQNQKVQLETALAGRLKHDARVLDIIKSRDTDNGELTKSANKALAYLNFRDGIVAGEKHDLFKPFDGDGNILNGAIEASIHLSKVSDRERRARDSDESLSTQDYSVLIDQAIHQAQVDIDQLVAERKRVEDRLNLVKAKRTLIEERKSDVQIDWNRRMAGVTARYLGATERLQSAAQGFSDAILDVFRVNGPLKQVEALRQALKFEGEGIGSGLDDVDIAVTGIQSWLDDVATWTTRHKICTLVETILSADRLSLVAKFPIKLTAEKFGIVRCRGMRCYLLGQDSIRLRIVSVAPPKRVQQFLDPETSYDQKFDPFDFGVIDMKEPTDEAFWAARQIWNCNPYGNWELTFSSPTGEDFVEGEKIVVELLLDQTPR